MIKTITKKEDKAQMILLSGFIISVAIITLASISSSISNVGTELSFETSTTPLDEYINVRDVFIKTFKNSCNGINDTDFIINSFNHIERRLFNIEMRYGNYFTADFLELKNYNNNTLQAIIEFKLVCKKTAIQEEIKIPISI